MKKYKATITQDKLKAELENEMIYLKLPFMN